MAGYAVAASHQLFGPSLVGGRSTSQAAAAAIGGQRATAAAAAAGFSAGAPAAGLGAFGLSVAAGMTSIVGRRRTRTSVAAFDPATMPGATEPFGFFDPLGFAKGKDEANFRKLRVAETKHGRVAMMASIGTVVSHYVKLPGFEKVPAGLGAIADGSALPGLAALFLASGAFEVLFWKDDSNKEPGDFNDPLGFAQQINVERGYELNNGRMAMISVLGQLAAEIVTGKDAVQQLGLQ